jgi:hypothetical protein
VLTAAGNTTVPADVYATFISGLSVISVSGTVSGQSVSVAIPEGVAGQVYVALTSAAAVNNVYDNSKVVAGPTIVEGEFSCEDRIISTRSMLTKREIVTPPEPVVNLNV